MPATTHPRFETYEVYDRHTGEVIGTFPSRRKAEAARTEFSHRVRGGLRAGATERGLISLLRGLAGRR